MQKSTLKTSHKSAASSTEGYSKKKQQAAPSNMPMSSPSGIENAEIANDFQDMRYIPTGEYGDGESIRVCLRVRPMNNMELSRGDEASARMINDMTCQISNKYNLDWSLKLTSLKGDL